MEKEYGIFCAIQNLGIEVKDAEWEKLVESWIAEWRQILRDTITIKDAECQATAERIIAELDKCFELAPNDDSYFRMLVRDTLEYIRTGKRSAERQALKKKEVK